MRPDAAGHTLGVPNPIPSMLKGARVLVYAVVDATVTPTGATRHVSAGVVVPSAAALAVARYDADPLASYYLFYLDPEGAVMTDTWHESVERAVGQAAFEYDGLNWTDVSS